MKIKSVILSAVMSAVLCLLIGGVGTAQSNNYYSAFGTQPIARLTKNADRTSPFSVFDMSQTGAFTSPVATITGNTLVDENNTGAECSLLEAIMAATTDAAYSGCTARNGSFLLTVNAAPPPTLGDYTNTTVSLGANTTITPNAAPTAAIGASATTTANFKGTLSVNPTTGVVRVTNAHPAGTFPVTVKAFGLSGMITKSFNLTVTDGTSCVGTTTFTASTNVSGNNPRSVAIGDFNNDGNQDFAVANSDLNSTSVLIRLGDGAGGFIASTDVSVGDKPWSVAVGDFNNDGNQDLAVANANSNNVSIRLGNGAGGFSGSTNVSVGDAPWSVAIGDFNNDGNQDLAVAHDAFQKVSIRLGDGAGNFSSAADLTVGFSPRSVAIGDFNNDGNRDLAVANANSNNVSIRLGNGAGGFNTAGEVSVGSLPETVAVGDFNNDGNQDFAAANFSSHTVSIRLGNGAGGFSGSTDVSVGINPSSVAIGDFNNDGNQDLAAPNGSNKAAIRLSDGAGNFSSLTDVSIGGFSDSIVIGDFNNDGKQDFATAELESDNLSIRLGRCSPPPTVTPPAAANLFIARTANQNSIARANTDGSSVTPAFLSVSGNSTGVAVDTAGGKIYWSQISAGKIGRANLDGSAANPDFITGLNNPIGMAIDTVNGKIYWAEDGGARIARANLDGTGVSTVISGVPGAYDVALNAANNKLYYVSGGSQNIGRSNLDGSNNNPAYIVTNGHLYGLDVDNVNGKIYWAGFNSQKIGRANLNATNIENAFIQLTTGADDVAVDAGGGKIYWTTQNGTVGSANLDGTNKNDSFLNGLGQTWGIALSDSANEGAPATRTGTYNQPDGAPVTITANIGSVTKTGTSSGTWTWSYTPSDGGASQNVIITGTASTGSTATEFGLYVNNVAPTIALTGSSIATQFANYTLNLGAITDPGTDTVTGYSINWGDGNTENFSGNPSGGSKTHTYATAGNKTITVSLTDEDGTHAGAGTKAIFVSENAAPTISDIADQTINGGASTGAISFTINDLNESASNLTLTGSSDNTTLVPNTNITFGGIGPTRTVMITPAANQYGTATITITVTDTGNASASDSFLLTVVTPQPFTVNNNGDAADANTNDGVCATAASVCTLRAAIQQANATPAYNRINFAAGLNGQTITLGSEIPITNNGSLLIEGLGANQLTIDGGAGTNRVFFIASGANVAINNLTVTGGNGTGSTDSGIGGAILNQGSLTVNNCSVSNNSASHGGGIYSYGNLNVNGCTFSGNSSSGNGGGIYLGFFGGGTITANVTNSTISGNTTVGFGGGIFLIRQSNNATNAILNLTNTTITLNSSNSRGGGVFNNFDAYAPGTLVSGTVNTRNTIIAENTASLTGPDVEGPFVSQGHNLIGKNNNSTGFTVGNPAANGDRVGTTASPVNPNLTALMNFGGTTATHALFPNSVAINNGNNALAVDPFNNTALNFDQRGTGFPRIRETTVDIGAFESIPDTPPTISDIADQSTIENTPKTNIAFTVFDLETSTANLTVAGSSDNTTLVPGANITFGGSGANRTVTITPAANQSGTATITVTVTDADNRSASDTFLLTVLSTTFTVNNIGDAGDANASDNICDSDLGIAGEQCSLRAAIQQANATAAGNRIIFAAGMSGQTITLGSEIPITNNGSLTIDGLGANLLTIDGGTGTNRIFYINGATVTIKGVTLQGGNGGGAVSTGWGGAIMLNTGGSLWLDAVLVQNCVTPNGGGGIVLFAGANHRITNSTFKGNTAGGNGGAINIAGSLFMANTTISGNQSNAFGGGIIINSGTATIRNSTITLNQIINTGSNNGGGIYFENSTLNLGNTIVAGNIAPATRRPDISANGTLQTAGYNLIGNNEGSISGFPAGNPNVNNDRVNVAANLAPLFNNGGTTPTHALLASVARENGSNALAVDPFNNTALAFDQRGTGFSRINGTNVDIGAFESIPDIPPTISDIADRAIDEDSSTGAIDFTVNDNETPPAGLVVSGSSNNTALVPNANITFGGSGASRTVTVTPAANQFGTATITVTVTDQNAGSASDSFLLTINPINDAPTISDITDRAIAQDNSTGAIAFTINDLETAANSLTPTGSSDNTTLVPNANIVFGGSGANRTVTITPAADQIGTATITVTITDANNASASDSFLLTVLAPQTFTVNNNGDAGDANTGDGVCDSDLATAGQQCALRAAVQEANATASQDRIIFAAGLSGQTIILGSEIPITNNGSLTIDGLGANQLAISGNNTTRIFSSNGATVIIRGVTLQNGNANGNGTTNGVIATGGSLWLDSVILLNNRNNSSQTGGVFFNGGANHRITNSTFTGNQSFYCAGFRTFNTTLFMVNTTISGNAAGGNGGGACILDNTIATIRNSTITNNSAPGGGGGFWLSVATGNFGNSIIAGNTGNATQGPDIWNNFATVQSAGYNLIGNNTSVNSQFNNNDRANVAANLAPLGNYGGTTPTHALLSNSVAINNGNNALAVDPFNNTALAFDQRGTGFSRINGTNVDIGAFESNSSAPPTISDITNQTTDEDIPTGAIPFTVESSIGVQTVLGSSSNQTLIPNGNIVFGGSGANRTVTMTPALNQNGTATITVTIIDANGTSASDSFVLTVNSVNDTPTISDITDRAISENGSTGAISFTISDAETAVNSLTLTGSSDNTTLVPIANITFGGSGTNRTVTITPAENQLGTATITITVTDANNASATDTFLLGVLGPQTFTVNNTGDAADANINDGVCATVASVCTLRAAIQQANNLASHDAINFAIPPADCPNGVCTITLTTVNGGEIPITNNGTLTINGLGANLLTIDGGTGTNRIFYLNGANVTVRGVTLQGGNGAGAVSTGWGGAIMQNNGGSLWLDAVLFQNNTSTQGGGAVVLFSGTNHRVTNSTFKGNTANGNGGAINIGGSLFMANTTISGNESKAFGGGIIINSGTTTIRNSTITLNTIQNSPHNGGGIYFENSTLNLGNTIVAGNIAPVGRRPDISANGTLQTAGYNLIGNNDGSSTGFPVGNPNGNNDRVNVAANLAPLGNYGGTTPTHALLSNSVAINNGNNALAVDPFNNTALAFDQRGTGFSRINGTNVDIGAFELVLNNLPTISDITDKVVGKNSTTGLIPFTIGDVETAAGSLTLSATSTNPIAIPVSNIVFGGSGANRTVTITPAANQLGTSTITITVTDEAGATASDSFTVVIDDTPTVSDITDTTTDEDVLTGVIAFTVGDAETSPGSLIVTAVSSNQTLVPDANITLGGSGADRTIRLAPALNQSGTTIVTVTVSDGLATAQDTFVLTVNAVNDAPSFTVGANQQIDANSGAQTVNNWATNISKGAADESGQTLTFNITDNTNPGLFSAAPAISPDGTLTYTSADDAAGTATVTVTLSDDGSNISPNVNTSAPQTFTITINAISTNPGGIGSAAPSLLMPGENTLLSVSVTPGTNPSSTGITVQGDLSSIGGSAAQNFFDDGTNGDATAGDNTFSYNATVAPATILGSKTLPITITDAQTRSGSANISLTVIGNTITWTGGTIGNLTNWNTATNWNPALIPASSNDVDIPSLGVSNEPAILASAVDVAINSLNEANGRTLTIESGRALTVTNSCIVEGTINVSGTFSCGSMNSTSGTLNFTGTGLQSIPAGTYNNLTINNAAGFTLSGDVTVNGALTLTNGIVNTGEHTLTIGSAGTITGSSSSSYVIGNLKKIFSAGGSELKLTSPAASPLALPAVFVYPVGTAAGISPVTINATAGGGNLAFTVSATESFLAGVNISQSIKRFWTLTPDGITQADITFQYLDADVPTGANESNFNFIRRSGSINTPFTPTLSDTAANSFTLNGVTQFSDWTLAGALAPTAATVSVSGRVLTPGGIGLAKARVILTDLSGNSRVAISSSFGYYHFEDVPVGATYIISIVSKRYTFTPQVIFVEEEREDLDFQALP